MRFVQAGLILLLGFWVFSPALHGEFLFDDGQALLFKPAIHRATGLWDIWFATPGPDYFPLTETVRWVQWHLWGKSVLGYHLTNIILHLTSALLLWRLLARLGVRLAWLGGLLFAVHPVTVESVAWISELKNTLSLPLLLLAMLAYLHFDRHGDRISYLRSIAAFIAAMLAKSSVTMFPVIILLHAWWRHGRIRAEDWKRSAPFFGIALVLGLVTVAFQHDLAPGSDPVEPLAPVSRLLCAGIIIAFYLAKCFWPAHLDIVYFRWDVGAAAGWEILSWVVLALFLGWLATRHGGWNRAALFGFLFFLINLVPVLGFIGMVWMNYSWVADHFIYLPLVGFVGLVAAAGGNLSTRYPHARLFLGVIAAGIVVAFALQSHAQAKLYCKSVDLWTHNLQENPASWLGYNNLAAALAAEGQPVEAIHEIQQGLKIRPDQALAYINWGNALVQLGHPVAALDAYQVALSLRPDDVRGHVRMANALVQAGRLDSAIEQYRTALQIDPAYAEAYCNLADIYIQTGHLVQAVDEARSALRIAPDYAEAHYNLGIALGQLGRIPEAVDQFAAAARFDPDDPEIQYNLGVALLQQGKSSEALSCFQRALQLNPGYGAARNAIERLQTHP